jgi:hypothetical protein
MIKPSMLATFLERCFGEEGKSLGGDVATLRYTAHPHNRLVCCHDIDHVINDEDIEP